MKRRHLFDNGYPVTPATYLAGSEVLLALSRRSLHNSRWRLHASCVRLANGLGRIAESEARCIYTRQLTHATRTQTDRAVETEADA